MRQLKPSTNLVLTVLAGLGLLASLHLPWFKAPVVDTTPTDGPIERGAFQVGQFFAGHAKGTVSGSDALGSGRAVVVALVVLLALAVLAVSVPAIRRQSEDVMRLLAVAGPMAVLVAVVVHPGTSGPVSVHYGILVSLALVAFMASAAWHGAEMRTKRPAPVRPRYGSAR